MGNIALTVSDTPDFREGERVFLFPRKVSSARSKGSLRKPKGPDSGTPGSILHCSVPLPPTLMETRYPLSLTGGMEPSPANK
jgi:hypothetical protein